MMVRIDPTMIRTEPLWLIWSCVTKGMFGVRTVRAKRGVRIIQRMGGNFFDSGMRYSGLIFILLAWTKVRESCEWCIHRLNWTHGVARVE